MKPNMQDVTGVIERARDRRGMSYAELSNRSHVPYNTVYMACKGRGGVKADAFVRICNELDLELEDFTAAIR